MKISRRQLKQIISETLFNEEEKKSGDGESTIVSTQYGDVDKDTLLKALNRVKDSHNPQGTYLQRINDLVDNLNKEDEASMATAISDTLKVMGKKDFIPGWTQGQYDHALGLKNPRA